MSIITVAAVQVPYFSPYRTPTLDTHSSGGEVKSGTGTKTPFELPLDFRSPSTSKNARWSPNQTPSERTAEEQHMSNNGTAPGLPLREGFLSLPSASAPHTSSGHGSMTAPTSGNDVKMENQPGHGYNFPPPRRRSPENVSEERKPSRSLGVQSILNPVYGGDDERPSRRRGAAQMDDEHKTDSASIASLSRPPSSSSVATDEISPPGPHGPQDPRVIRHILTPVSPRLRRTTSFSRITTGTINAHDQPFLSPSGRTHTQEPGTGGIPPLPTANPGHVQQRSPYALPSAPTPPLASLPAPRRASMGLGHSTRASPSPSYSSYGHSVQASPTMSHHYPSGSGPTPPGSYRLAPSPVVGSLSNIPPVSLEGDQQQQQQQQGYGIPVVSSGQNYQLLTIETGRGQTQLPVEVQAASRMADEKRKRNAGASARFRARRKEKEREASSRISNLEQELAFAREDSEHYRRERDYLADIIVRTVPHYESYFRDRPQSPRIGRVMLRQVSECPSSMGDESPAPTTSVPISLERYEHLERIERLERLDRERAEAERPATRRRTESFPVASPGPHSYASSPFPPYAPPPTGQQHPHQHQGQPFTSPASGGGPPQQPSPRGPSPHEQYRMEQPYDRNWPRSGPPR
jgi:hypothetical protein